jgi:hypothetical protein
MFSRPRAVAGESAIEFYTDLYHRPAAYRRA